MTNDYKVPPAHVDLAGRLSFMNIDDDEKARIRSVKAIVERVLPSALSAFYEKVQQTPSTAKFFSSRQHMESAKSSQIRHWDALSSAAFDARFADNVRRIGNVHARIGLEPRWYIGGYAHLAEKLVAAIVTDAMPANPAAADLGRTLGAFLKAVFLDMDLAVSVYMDAAEKARIAAEERAKEEERGLVQATLGGAIKELSDKKLSYRLDTDLPGSYHALQDDFNTALADLDEAMQAVAGVAEGVADGTEELAAASTNLATRTEAQAASIEHSSTAMKEFSTAMSALAGLT